VLGSEFTGSNKLIWFIAITFVPLLGAIVSGMAGEHESDFAARLRDLEELKSDCLISGDEYQKKRSEMLQEKW